MTLNPADTGFAAGLSAQLPEGSIMPAPAPYLTEPRGKFFGQGGLLARPRTTDEVATILAACHAAGVGVVPYGGGTGLVGGQVMPDGPAPVILSVERMNAIRATRPEENVIVAEAGAILADVQGAAAAGDRLFPLSLASEGSARIGGLLSTNAGGVNVLRYGNARDLCLGLEAVLPDGTIYNGLSRLRKDNTGYDLRNLLIGAEGTLGVITAASLKLFARPASVGTALLVVNSPDAALALLSLARDEVGEAVSSFELIHRQGFDFFAEVLPDIRLPFAQTPDWMVLVEFGLARGQSADKALERLFVAGMDAGLVHDGLIAQNESQRKDFWALREHIPEANRLIGAISSHDISVPLSALPEFVRRGHEALGALGPFRINCFGHLGDGNLHYNVFPPKDQKRGQFAQQVGQVQRTVYDLVHEFGGSVSAEHGVGRLKTGDLARYGDPAKLMTMHAIKTALDPKGIMNPGAVLPR